MSVTQGLYQFGGKLYAAWKGEVGDDRLFYASFNGTTWEPGSEHIPGNSCTGPSLASATSNALYAMWRGEGSDNDLRIFYSRFNGTTWDPQTQMPDVASSIGPSLGVVGSVLYAAWKGEDGDNQLYWSQLNASGWTAQQVMSGAKSVIGPSLAGYNGKLYAAWIGVNGQTFEFAELVGNSWQPAPQIPGNPGSSTGPSLAECGGLLYAVWKGQNTDQGLYYASFDKTTNTWSGQIPIANFGSSIGPALAAYGSDLYAVWVGKDNDQSLYYAKFDGSWHAQNPLGGNTGQDNVLPPFGGLSSNSNYLIGSGDGAHLKNPTVTITITEDLVVEPSTQNFGFQLNSYSPSGALVDWQQYLIVPHLDTQTVSGGLQNYAGSAGQLFSGATATSLATPANYTIPAKWQFTMALKTDSSDNVKKIEFRAIDIATSQPLSMGQPLHINLESLTLNAGGKVQSKDLAPIVAFQLNIVGQAGNSQAIVFTSGAGTITYSADNQLVALRAVPSDAETNVPTEETANSTYTAMSAHATGSLVQGFGVAG